MAVKPVVYDDSNKKHRPLGSGEKMDGLSASSIISSQSGNLITTGSDGLAYATGSGIADPAADNLIEATSGGKLKVDMDRVIEWLDGHPADAKTLSEAIKVVSGDSGNLIAKGSDKGAYMSSASLANALAGMSAAQLQQLAGALADGKTIVASGGKLTVDPTSATAAQLNKISSAIRKSGGGLSVGSDGKLSVDFASMDPAIMRAVVLSMVQQGGGIGVDQNGQLFVDFDSMPTDKFEAMLKSLKMLVPLDANMHVYVDTNNSAAGDTIIDGRGTQAKPFKTIQAAVNYVTGNYSIGKWRAYIHIGAGTYTENLTLPSYAAGSGYIRLESASGSRDVVVNAAALANGTVHWCAASDGGRWDIYNIEFRRTEAPTLSTTGVVTGCIQASASGAVINLFGCAFRQIVPADLPAYSVGYGVRIISADGRGRVNLRHGTIAGSITAASRADVSVTVLNVSRGGGMYFYYVMDDSVSHEIAVSGSCTVFMSAWQSGTTNTVGTGSPLTFSGTMTGKKYEARTGSFICVGQNASYFPGDTAGTVDDSTYCWYA